MPAIEQSPLLRNPFNRPSGSELQTPFENQSEYSPDMKKFPNQDSYGSTNNSPESGSIVFGDQPGCVDD